MGNRVTSLYRYDSLGRLNVGWACKNSTQYGCTEVDAVLTGPSPLYERVKPATFRSVVFSRTRNTAGLICTEAESNVADPNSFLALCNASARRRCIQGVSESGLCALTFKMRVSLFRNQQLTMEALFSMKVNVWTRRKNCGYVRIMKVSPAKLTRQQAVCFQLLRGEMRKRCYAKRPLLYVNLNLLRDDVPATDRDLHSSLRSAGRIFDLHIATFSWK
jgi:hypothetical protein